MRLNNSFWLWRESSTLGDRIAWTSLSSVYPWEIEAIFPSVLLPWDFTNNQLHSTILAAYSAPTSYILGPNHFHTKPNKAKHNQRPSWKYMSRVWFKVNIGNFHAGSTDFELGPTKETKWSLCTNPSISWCRPLIWNWHVYIIVQVKMEERETSRFRWNWSAGYSTNNENFLGNQLPAFRM